MRYHFSRGNFHHQHQELEDEPWNSPSSTPGKSSPSSTPGKSSPSSTPTKSSPSSTPKRSSPCSTPRKSKKSSKNSKSNPFASRGLDKFSALLTELNEKRQKIYSQMGSEEAVPMVHFVYSSSNDCIPVVVRVKDHQKQDKTKTGRGTTDHIKDKHMVAHTEIVDKLPEKSTSVPDKKKFEQPTSESDKKTQMSNSKFFELNKKLHNWRRPSYYMPAAMVLILLLLLFFGRSVAILCISLGWYIVPTLNTDMVTKKKEYVRRLSDNKMVNHGVITSPRRNSIGDVKDKWPRQHGQRKSF